MSQGLANTATLYDEDGEVVSVKRAHAGDTALRVADMQAVRTLQDILDVLLEMNGRVARLEAKLLGKSETAP